jgi:hypothetical protein
MQQAQSDGDGGGGAGAIAPIGTGTPIGPAGSAGAGPQVMRWYKEEEEYLRNLYLSCLEISKEYMKLYVQTHRIQTRLRLPTIMLSSFSGVASFGSSGFDQSAQRWISISVGVINVGIAIIQTYESYLKIGDVVSKSLSGSQSLKKVADDILCELSLPIEDRDSNGVTFLREIFGRYQAIIDTLPPLEHNYDLTVMRASQELKNDISGQMRAYDDDMISVRNSAVVTPKDRTSEPYNLHGHAVTSGAAMRQSVGGLRTNLSVGTPAGGAAGGAGPGNVQIELNVGQ